MSAPREAIAGGESRIAPVASAMNKGSLNAVVCSGNHPGQPVSPCASGAKSSNTTGSAATTIDRYDDSRAASSPIKQTLTNTSTTSNQRAEVAATANGYPGGKWPDGTWPSNASASCGEYVSHQNVDGTAGPCPARSSCAVPMSAALSRVVVMP